MLLLPHDVIGRLDIVLVSINYSKPQKEFSLLFRSLRARIMHFVFFFPTFDYVFFLSYSHSISNH